MSILKKIMGSVVLLVVLFFAGSVPVTAASQAMQEHEPLYFCFGDYFLYPYEVEWGQRPLMFSYDGEDLKFDMYDDRILRLMSADGTKDYLSFMNYRDSAPCDYVVYPIFTTSSDRVFYLIEASIGAHAENAGYWIVGKENGRWVALVSIDTLAVAGYTPNKWHSISTKIVNGPYGNLIVKSYREYMPLGRHFGYQRMHVEDFTAEIYWDWNTEKMVVRKL